MIKMERGNFAVNELREIGDVTGSNVKIVFVD
jgi:hypothetical protein